MLKIDDYEITYISDCSKLTEPQREHWHVWIEALESGKYTQAQRSLCVGGEGAQSFCCLGVACDLAAEELNAEWKSRAGQIQFIHRKSRAGSAAFLPDFVSRLYGLFSRTGVSLLYRDAEDPTIQHNADLTSLNDVLEFDFKQIAQVLRMAMAGGLKTEYGV